MDLIINQISILGGEGVKDTMKNDDGRCFIFDSRPLYFRGGGA